MSASIVGCHAVIGDEQSITGIGRGIDLTNHPIVIAGAVVEFPVLIHPGREIGIVGQVLDAQRSGEIHRLPSRARADGRDLHNVVLAALQTVEDVIAVVRGAIIGPGGVGQNAIADSVTVVGEAHPRDGGGIGGDVVGCEVIDGGALRTVENGNVVHCDSAAAGLLGEESELDVVGA